MIFLFRTNKHRYLLSLHSHRIDPVHKTFSAPYPRISVHICTFFRIPGALSDRRTMLGELNWIFTAITDTIAWNVLPRGIMQNVLLYLLIR